MPAGHWRRPTNSAEQMPRGVEGSHLARAAVDWLIEGTASANGVSRWSWPTPKTLSCVLTPR
jgi:hypothetical protein